MRSAVNQTDARDHSSAVMVHLAAEPEGAAAEDVPVCDH